MRRVWKDRRTGSGTTIDTRIERMDRDVETAAPERPGSVTVGGSARSVRRERTLILALLLMLAAASWALLIWQSRTMNGMGLTMGMGAALFLAIWVVMMIAMMFPTDAPMILVFARVQRDRRSGGGGVL